MDYDILELRLLSYSSMVIPYSWIIIIMDYYSYSYYHIHRCCIVPLYLFINQQCVNDVSTGSILKTTSIQPYFFDCEPFP